MSLFEPKFLFIHNRKTSRNYVIARTCVRVGASKLPKGDRVYYRVGTENNQGVKRDYDGAKRRAAMLLREKHAGVDIRIQAFREGNPEVLDQVRFRKTLKAGTLKPTPGNVYLDRVEGFVESTFQNSRWAGDCVCKPNSDHRWCRAVDYFDSTVNMIKIRDAILNNNSYFNYTYVILFDRIWYGSGNSDPYGGDYHSHVHISVGGTSVSAC